VRKFPRRTISISNQPAGTGGLRDVHTDLISFDLSDELLIMITRDAPRRFIAEVTPHIDVMWVKMENTE